MDVEEIAREKDEVERRYGVWTAHNIRLADGVYTMGPHPQGDEVKLHRVVQLVRDLAGPVERLRILDLACLEGMYAIEFASRGAEAVAIEGREANIEKARFAARALGLENVHLELGDVRGLSRERHGEFDVVLCLGILYHLDADDVFRLIEQIAEVCRGIAVFDTWVAGAAVEWRSHDGGEYAGVSLFEHEPDSDDAERLARLWSSLDNPQAFAPTRPSLYRLLEDAGFSSVLEAVVPPEADKPADRITLVAIRGERERLRLVPEPEYAFPPEPSGQRSRLDSRRLRTRTRRLARQLLRRPLRRL